MRKLILTELFFLKIYFNLLRRDFRKYFSVSSACYWLGTLNVYAAAKPCYFFCRYSDDLADGDIKGSFEEFLNRIDNNTDSIELLALGRAKKSLIKAGRTAYEVDGVFKDFIKLIQVDYLRRQSRRVFSDKELKEHHIRSFSAVLKMTSWGMKIDFSKELIESLSLIQGRAYALQDLEEDLSKGIINVPKSVWNNYEYSFEQWRDLELSFLNAAIRDVKSRSYKKEEQRLINLLINPIHKWALLQNKQKGSTNYSWETLVNLTKLSI